MSPANLPFELLALVFNHLIKLHAVRDGDPDEAQQQGPPLLTVRAAVAVAAAASAHPQWLAACLAEVG